MPRGFALSLLRIFARPCCFFVHSPFPLLPSSLVFVCAVLCPTCSSPADGADPLVIRNDGVRGKLFSGQTLNTLCPCCICGRKGRVQRRNEVREIQSIFCFNSHPFRSPLVWRLATHLPQREGEKKSQSTPPRMIRA